MRKVLVIGSGGAGKSTFSRRLAGITGIELIHLDKIHWRPNWVEPSKEEWQQTVKDVIKKDSWILDGNYSGTLAMRIEACDTVIFLDTPRLICIYQVLKRIALYKRDGRPDMAEGCDEKLDLKFLSWIWSFSKRSKPRIKKLLKQFESEKKIITLKSRAEIENFFVNLK